MQIFELACQPHFADEMGRICRCGCLLQHGWQFWASTFCGLRFDQISRPVLAFFVDPTAFFSGFASSMGSISWVLKYLMQRPKASFFSFRKTVPFVLIEE